MKVGNVKSKYEDLLAHYNTVTEEIENLFQRLVLTFDIFQIYISI